MDHQLRQYLVSKSSKLSFRTPQVQDPELRSASVAYESTIPDVNPPIFLFQPLRRSMTEQRARDAHTGLALRSVSYESALPGKAPIIGGRPHRGNGPVKLQTSRRLSSGELLLTHQDHQRTLEDIREGEYIVGGVEKRHSRVSQAKSPTSSQRNSFASPTLHSKRQSSTATLRDTHTPQHSWSKASTSRSSGRSQVEEQLPTSPDPSSALPSVCLGSTSDTFVDAGRGLAISNVMAPVVEEVDEPESSQTTHRGQRSSMMQALWKAEQVRLAAIYQASRGRQEATLSTHQGRRPSAPPDAFISASGKLSKGLLDPLIFPHPYITRRTEAVPQARFDQPVICDYNASDTSSDYCSDKRTSMLISEASSSSYTIRSSIHEPDTLSTREDVRRIVDGIRSTFLEAIEAHARDSSDMLSHGKVDPASTDLQHDAGQSERPRKIKVPLRHTGVDSAKLEGQSSGEAAQPAFGKFVPAEACETAASDHLADSGTRLERADSLTLGSLMETLSPRKPRRKSSTSADDGAGG